MREGPLGGRAWKEIFVARGAWDLTPEYIDAWRAQNETFFGFVEQYVPPGGKIAELGCGPGRHAISLASMGYRVVAVDLDPAVLAQAKRNAGRLAPPGRIQLCRGDMLDLGALPELAGVDAVSHGGLMEHFESREAVRRALAHQLEHAAHVVFDVPLGTPKNQALFRGDGVFRQDWSRDEWLEEVLAGFDVIAWEEEIHDHSSMTDDLICVLGR